MNLLDSHDTERLLWTLTPGAETPRRAGAERGQRRRGQAARAARVADPVHRARARRPSTTATRSGSPATTTRTTGGRTRGPTSAAARTRRCSPTTRRWPRCAATVPALRTGDFRILLADDARRHRRLRPQDGEQAAIVGGQPQRLGADARHPGRRLRAGRHRARAALRRQRRRRLGRPAACCTSRSLPAERRVCSRAAPSTSQPPAAPTGLHVTGEGDGSLARLERRRRAPPATTSTSARSRGGGYVKANARAAHRHDVHDHRPRQRAHVLLVVRALDAAGNASAASNEVFGAAAPRRSAGRTSSGRRR